VVLLVSFLAIILMKVLRSDIVRYMGIDDLEDDLDGESGEEEAGWKLIHGHVFRPPQPLVLFCSMIGVGGQFFAMIVSVLSLALLGLFSPMRRGGVATAAVLLYTGTSFIGGYVSARLYRQLSKGDGNWAWTAVLTVLMFPLPCTISDLSAGVERMRGVRVRLVALDHLQWAHHFRNELPAPRHSFPPPGR